MNDLVVDVEQGRLSGSKVKGAVGGVYIFFKGIPYAAPPVGNMRFEEPRPPQPWSGVREAFKYGPKCVQIDSVTKEVTGDEDCLYLNVATSSLKGSRPVMVWIHGGAFIHGDGSGELYGPDYLMKTDIVFVSINYRLGVLGFLPLEHEVSPGNMGLKDQVAALKWVKQNIAQFGGDPNNVTIFGESAGAASVHYLLLSPLAKGLFRRAILQSGTTLNPWVYTPTSIDNAYRLVAALGKETNDPREIVSHLRTIPADQLVKASEEVRPIEEKLRWIHPFRPNVDDKSRNPLMPRPPAELAAEGVDVPILLGYNSHEGMIFLIGLTDETLETFDANPELVVPHHLSTKAPSKVSEIAQELRKFYFGDKKLSMETLENYVQCYSDVYFNSGIHDTVEYQRKKKTPTYLYKFSYDSPKSFGKIAFNKDMKGTAHADDLPYLFHSSRFADKLVPEPGSIEQTISDRFVQMWANFARCGDPTPEINDLIPVKWEPVTRTTKHYLAIDAELTVGVNPDEEMTQLFKRISEIASSP